MEEALVQARAGNLDAWIELSLLHMRGLAGSYSQSSGIDADDLLQDVALKIWLKSAKILAMEDPTRYVMMLARNLMIDRYRSVAARRRRVTMISLEQWQGGAYEQV